MTTLLPTLVREQGMDPYMEAGGSLNLGEGLTLFKYDPSVHGPAHDSDDSAYITLHVRLLITTFNWRSPSVFVQVQPEAGEPIVWAIRMDHKYMFQWLSPHGDMHAGPNSALAMIEDVSRHFASHAVRL